MKKKLNPYELADDPDQVLPMPDEANNGDKQVPAPLPPAAAIVPADLLELYRQRQELRRSMFNVVDTYEKEGLSVQVYKLGRRVRIAWQFGKPYDETTRLEGYQQVGKFAPLSWLDVPKGRPIIDHDGSGHVEYVIRPGQTYCYSLLVAGFWGPKTLIRFTVNVPDTEEEWELERVFLEQVIQLHELLGKVTATQRRASKPEPGTVRRRPRSDRVRDALHQARKDSEWRLELLENRTDAVGKMRRHPAFAKLTAEEQEEVLEHLHMDFEDIMTMINRP